MFLRKLNIIGVRSAVCFNFFKVAKHLKDFGAFGGTYTFKIELFLAISGNPVRTGRFHRPGLKNVVRVRYFLTNIKTFSGILF